MKIKFNPAEKSRVSETDFTNLGFGKFFSDNMFEMDYVEGKWQNAQIIPYGNISVSPATMVFHYGQAVFEGIKAFNAKDGVNVFRPKKFFERLNNSCRRLAIPEVEEEIFMDAVTDLVKLEKNWVPKQKNASLYLRPFIFASDPYIGVCVSKTYKFMIIASPVGAYYNDPNVRLYVTDQYIRASKGGLGAAKTPANYAASLMPAELAKKKGFDQVLWLDGVEGKYLEEVGSMNIFVLFEDELATPQLNGSILSGVTRDSVITLAKDFGVKVSERKISIDEVMKAGENNTLKEVFGTGTAAVVSPVTELTYKNKTIKVNSGGKGSLSQRLYDEITGIQYGTKADKHNWMYKVKV
jgi:branched-chain amino acid aminotransferase